MCLFQGLKVCQDLKTPFSELKPEVAVKVRTNTETRVITLNSNCFYTIAEHGNDLST